MAATIGVEAARKTVGREHLSQPAQARKRSLLLHQKGRIDRTGRIVERDDQIECQIEIRNPPMA
jgi:hypothetical protein